MTPVTPGVQVAQEKFVLQADLDPRQTPGDLAGHKGFAPQRGLMVEEDPIAGVHAVGFAVVHGDPVAVHLGYGVRGTRIKWRLFRLRNLLHETIQLGGGGLVKACLVQVQGAHGLQQPEYTQRVGVGRVLRLLERDLHVTLRGEVVYLVRLDLLHDVKQARRVRHVPVVQDEAAL